MYKDLMSMEAGDFQNELGKVLVKGFLESSLEHQLYTILAAYAASTDCHEEFKTPEEAILGLIGDAQGGLEYFSDSSSKNSKRSHNFKLLKEGLKTIISNCELKDFSGV